MTQREIEIVVKMAIPDGFGVPGIREVLLGVGSNGAPSRSRFCMLSGVIFRPVTTRWTPSFPMMPGSPRPIKRL